MRKLKLIQCGVGGMGKTWRQQATSVSADFEIAALVDINAAALLEAAEELHVPTERCFDSLEGALERVEADAVLTVTPPAVHVEHAKLAFARGLHVLTEKPIADDLANAKLMVKLAADAGKQLVVAQNYRYHAPMMTLRRAVEQRIVGDIGHGHLDFYIGADFTGTFRQSMKFPLLVDMAIHHLDLIRCITGRNIAQVSALSFRPAWSWYEHEPALKMMMRLDDDTPFSYSGDWSALGRQTRWNGNWRLQCAQGSLHIDRDQAVAARCEKWCKDEREETLEHVTPAGNGQAMLLRDFAEAIRTGKPAATSGADNLWSFGAVIAGMISAAEGGRWVDVAGLVA